MNDFSEMSQQIAAWLPKARWFAGKGAAISGVSVVDATNLPGTGIVLTIIAVDDGNSLTRYAVPVFADTGVDAASTGPFAGWLLETVRGESAIPAQHGRVVGRSVSPPGGHPGPAGSATGPHSIAPLGGDASNTSLLVHQAGTALAVKLVRRSEPGLQPEVEVGRFLTETAGWQRTPALRGWLQYEPDDAGPPTVLATVHAFLPECKPAWEFLCDVLASDRDGKAIDATCVPMAASLGAITGEMHLALASRADISAFAPAAEHEADRRRTAHAMADRIRRVLGHAATRASTFPSAMATRLTRVAAAKDRLAEACLAVTDLGGVQRIRVHGDYHLGQVLARPNGDAYVIDFEGEPARSLQERAEKTSPCKDIAGMCRSFDYLLRYAAVSTGRPYVATELAALEAAFLAAYRERAAGQEWWPPDDALATRLLAVWKIDKAVYELAYEIDNRPDWVEVPLGALETLLDAG